VFAGQATFLINTAQAQDLKVKGPGYLEMLKGLGESVARRLEGVELTTPDVVYDTSYDLDLGGRVVQLRAVGRAHSQGDQVVTVPDAAVMFTGDVVEAGQFAIFPWFPPYDTDVSGTRWIAVMQRMACEGPRVSGTRAMAMSAVRNCWSTRATICSCCTTRPGSAETRP
jgi:glyoxylase-like metal-dependent hydrolase (beta-lactamase superfamily II)